MTMADHTDDLLSRYLDGDVSEVERARVETDPALTDRAQRMRAAIGMVGATIDVPTFDLDRIRSRVMLEHASLDESPVEGGDVTSLATARVRRRKGAGWLEGRDAKILAAAAVVMSLALGVGALASLGQDDDLDVAFDAPDRSGPSADEAGAEAEAATMEMSAAEEAGGDDADSYATEEALPLEDAGATADAPDDGDGVAQVEFLDRLPDELEPVADLEALRDRIADLEEEALAEFRTIVPDGVPFGGLCDPLVEVVVRSLDAEVAVVDTATIEIGGQPSVVAIATGVDGTSVTVVVDTDCATVEILGIGPD